MARLVSRLRRRPAVKAVRRALSVVLLRAMTWTSRRMPRRLALACGECLAGALLPLARRRFRNVMENLRQAFGGSVPRPELARIARRCARTMGRTLFEFFRIPSTAEREVLSLVDADSFEPVERALGRGKGLVLFGAHMGAWEVLAAYMAARFGKPFHAVGFRLYYRPLNDMLVGMRRSAGVETVYQDQGARPLLSILHRNLPLGILADVDVYRLDWARIEFLGRETYAPTGPAALARASGAALVPMFMTWNGRRHRLHVLPEIEVARTRDKQADLVRITRACSLVIEGIVRRYPEQWMGWAHAWRTSPPRPRGRK